MPEHYRPAWAEINLGNLDHNFHLVRKLVGAGVKILVPVKADAYGHGIIAVSKRLEKLGVDYLGVASIDEGIILRKNGIKKPILVLSPIFPDGAEAVLRHNLIPAVCAWELALKLDGEAARRKQKAVIHIKVDTGMHRIGIAHHSARLFIRQVSRLKNIFVEGIFTHFPCADNNPAFTRQQIGMFEDLIRQLEKEGIHIPLKHAANSLGVLDYPAGHFNMVRPGLIVYGLSPRDRLRHKLLPVLSLKTRIAYVKAVDKGKGVSYGHTFVTALKTRIATLPVGYGDGYPRSLSNKAFCLIGGKRVRIVGRICMDQMMADVTNIRDVKTGQEAVLIGRQKAEAISAEELAKLAGTIPYEIVCNLGQRIPRVYRKG
ncbi:MAG TPA: alanine racemase [Candidatus Omnitrophota bacterium]|nr:alanine racemase [Candidatus Omnitrophota bacterium]